MKRGTFYISINDADKMVKRQVNGWITEYRGVRLGLQNKGNRWSAIELTTGLEVPFFLHTPKTRQAALDLAVIWLDNHMDYVHTALRRVKAVEDLPDEGSGSGCPMEEYRAPMKGVTP